MNIKELREKVARLVTEARSKMNEITDDTTPEAASEIEQQVDAMLDEARSTENQIERLEKMEKLERNQEAAAEAEERAQREARRPGGAGSTPGADTESGPDYETAFRTWLGYAGDVTLLTPEERSALRGGYSSLPTEERAQTTTAAAGGYTIPEQMRVELIRTMLAWGPMYDPGVTFEMMTSGGNPMPIPTVDDTTVTAEAAPAQGTTLTDDGGKDVTFGEKQLDAYSYQTEWIRCSMELVQDSAFSMEVTLGSLLGERLGRIANLQLTTGTGSGAPNGIVTVSTLGITAASATAITSDEIIDLEHSVDPLYRMAPTCRFMMNDATLKAVRKLKDGDGNYLWQMGNIQTGAPGSLLGYSYSINQAMSTIATGNRTMVFGDFRKYYVRKIANMPLIQAIQDKDFWPGFGIAGYIRFDGELVDTAAVKHLIQA